jgi:hypothetical protein
MDMTMTTTNGSPTIVSPTQVNFTTLDDAIESVETYYPGPTTAIYAQVELPLIDPSDSGTLIGIGFGAISGFYTASPSLRLLSGTTTVIQFTTNSGSVSRNVLQGDLLRIILLNTTFFCFLNTEYIGKYDRSVPNVPVKFKIVGDGGSAFNAGPYAFKQVYAYPIAKTVNGPTGAIPFYDAAGAGLTGSTGLLYNETGPTGPSMVVAGDILPAADLTYSLGSTGSRFTSIHIGGGTVFIGPTGTLGNDPNGIIYAQQGFAAPTIVLGATIPGATGPVGGGVRLSLTGPTGPIQYQQLDENGGPTGSVYNISSTVPGSEATIPSGFTGALEGGATTVTLGNGSGNAVKIASTEITIYNNSRLFGQASVELEALTNSTITVSLYMIVDGETTNSTNATNKGSGEYSNIVLFHRTAVKPPGTYVCELWGYASASNAIHATHCDIFAMGNLA